MVSRHRLAVHIGIRLQGTQMQLWLFVLAGYENGDPIITSAQGRATTRSSGRDATSGTGNDICRAEYSVPPNFQTKDSHCNHSMVCI